MMSGTFRIGSNRAAGFSHVGRRGNNEDAFLVEPVLGLYAVADGMGGYEGGEVASRIVIDTLASFFTRALEDSREWARAFSTWDSDGRCNAELQMELALRLAHREVVAQAEGRLADMGSTVAAVLVGDGIALTAHIGDSRVYRVRDGVIEQLTIDHSVVADLQRAECAGLLEHLPPRYSAMITRSVAANANAEAEIHVVPTLPGDAFIISTDGLHDVLTPIEIGTFVSDNAAKASAGLCEAAYEAGSMDNITAVVVHV